MAALNASVQWCGVAGTVPDFSAAATDSIGGVTSSFHDCIDDASCLPLLAQQGREFGCSGCSIIELIIAGSRRMTLNAPGRQLQWTAKDFESNVHLGFSNVHEFAARRGIMRMLQQEDHEVFMSTRMWRSALQRVFAPGWSFSEAFDGRLLLLPFFHRAQLDADSTGDVTLVLHMDASRLSNLDLVARSWGGPISVVIIVCVARITCHFKSHGAVDAFCADTPQTQMILTEERQSLLISQDF